MIITKEMIDKCFEGETQQINVLINLYKLLHPEWDKIKKFNGFPSCSVGLSKRIFKKFMMFDEIHHPDVMAGGLWMNNGFSTLGCEDYKEWEARPCDSVETE